MVSSSAAEAPVVIVYNEFPKRSETFLFHEFTGWRERGLHVRAFSLRPAARQLPKEMAAWRDEVLYLHRAERPRSVRGLLREALRALSTASLASAWRALRRARHARLTVAGWIAGVGLAHAARSLEARRIHAAWCNVPAEAAFHASRILGVPYTVSAHAADVWRDLPTSADCLASAEAVFVCNHEAARGVLLGNPALASRLRVLPHGADIARFPLAERLPGPPWRLLAVARLVPKKGLETLIETCRELRLRQLAFECLLVGEGPLTRLLRRRIHEVGLDGRVRLTGPVDHTEVAALMAQSHVLLMTSRISPDGDREGLPNSLLEAMLTGLPVVATRTGSVEEVIGDRVTGRLVEVEDVGSMADAVMDIAGDYPRAVEIGRAGRQRVLAHLAQEDQASALARIFAPGLAVMEVPPTE